MIKVAKDVPLSPIERRAVTVYHCATSFVTIVHDTTVDVEVRVSARRIPVYVPSSHAHIGSRIIEINLGVLLCPSLGMVSDRDDFKDFFDFRVFRSRQQKPRFCMQRLSCQSTSLGTHDETQQKGKCFHLKSFK